MNAFQRLQAAKSQRTEQAPATVEAEYIEKLASACEYAAAQVIGKSITGDKEPLPVHNYVPQPSFVEKVAHKAPAPDLMAKLLREKIAYKQAAEQEEAVKNSDSVVAGILARFAKIPNAEATARDKQVFTVEPSTVNPVAHETNSVDAVAALAGTSLSDVLEAAQNASEAGASATASSVKTASAQGKGPLTVGAATSRLRERLVRRAASK